MEELSEKDVFYYFSFLQYITFKLNKNILQMDIMI